MAFESDGCVFYSIPPSLLIDIEMNTVEVVA